MSDIISDLLGRKTASKSEQRQVVPRHFHSSVDLRTPHRKTSESHLAISIPSPGLSLPEPPRPFASGMGTQASRGRAVSLDTLGPPARLTTDQSQLPPSLLRAETRVTQSGPTAEAEHRRLVREGLGVPRLQSDQGSRWNLSTDLLLSQHDTTAQYKDEGFPLTGIGAQHDSASDAAFL